MIIKEIEVENCCNIDTRITSSGRCPQATYMQQKVFNLEVQVASKVAKNLIHPRLKKLTNSKTWSSQIIGWLTTRLTPETQFDISADKLLRPKLESKTASNSKQTSVQGSLFRWKITILPDLWKYIELNGYSRHVVSFFFCHFNNLRPIKHYNLFNLSL